MPNRILKESICTSESIDSLTAYQEVFFYRLIVNCDDYGRMDGREKILAAKLFPLKEITTDTVKDCLDALIGADLITIYVVDGKPYIQMNAWDKHQQVRSKRSKYPSPSMCEMKQFADTCKQMISDDDHTADGLRYQMISNDYKCPRNPIQSESLSESESVSVSELTDSDAHVIQREQDMVLNAAENAGFNKSTMSRAKIVELYAEHGKDKILNAIGECVKYGVTNLAYLEAVLRGGPRKAKPKVNAQNYEQRDYTDVQDEFERQQNEYILQRLKEGG